MEKDGVTELRKIVILGGSAGSLDVLMQILPNLPQLQSIALVIVLHRKSGEDNTLEELIAMKTETAVKEVNDKVPLLPGFIYVAPSDYHLLFEKNNTLSLDISEKINYSRPSIDVAFESAAEAHGAAVAAVLLSGANADGTVGLQSVKACGGMTIVQQPQTAEMPFMPEHAVANMNPDYILNVGEIRALIVKLDS